MTSGIPDAMTGSTFTVDFSTGASLLPYCLREAVVVEQQQGIDLDEQDEESLEKFPVLRCRTCSHTITSDDQRLQIAGSHHHTFFNPVGIVYELGCFNNAPGCSVLGESSSEFSWFAGYLWRIALCARCGTHLGWRFESAVQNNFYGLILSLLQSSEK